MSVNTAARDPLAAVETPRAPRFALENARWKKRYLFSSFRDRRPLREIGGVGAYLTQVRWSLWWALRR